MTLWRKIRIKIAKEEFFHTNMQWCKPFSKIFLCFNFYSNVVLTNTKGSFNIMKWKTKTTLSACLSVSISFISIGTQSFNPSASSSFSGRENALEDDFSCLENGSPGLVAFLVCKILCDLSNFFFHNILKNRRKQGVWVNWTQTYFSSQKWCARPLKWPSRRLSRFLVHDLTYQRLASIHIIS